MPGRCQSGAEPGADSNRRPTVYKRLVTGCYDDHRHRWLRRGHVRGSGVPLGTGAAVSGGADYAQMLFRAEHRERGPFRRPISTNERAIAAERLPGPAAPYAPLRPAGVATSPAVS
jgi:hypothetical protein